MPLEHNEKYVRTSTSSNMNIVVPIDNEQETALSAMPYMLESCLNKLFASYSVWATSGSECVAPCLFTTQNLPPLSGIAAMLDGQWQQRQWQQPFHINDHNQYCLLYTSPSPRDRG